MSEIFVLPIVTLECCWKCLCL